MAWAEQELATINLGDLRLDQRAITLLETLAQSPAASIPGACQTWAQTQAAYRFIGNDKVSWEGILAPHWHSTLARMRQHPVVLHIQDTTELDFHGQDIEGIGPLSYETRLGMYLHPTYVITPQREPLGITDAWMWARGFKDKQGQRPPAVSESLRWIEGYERVVQQAQQLPATRHVYIADREADILALILKGQQLDYAADFLVRSKHNRAIPKGGKLWQNVEERPLLGTIRFEIPKGRGRKARWVDQEIRVSREKISDGKRGWVEVTCIVASEVNPPKGSQAVVWRLLTNRRVDTLAAALELIEWYRARWEIELFFLILKEGCRVERLQLSEIGKLETALSLYMVIAWRINRLMRLGRQAQQLDASVVFEEAEWKAAYILNRKRPPTSPPTLYEVMRLIAQLGGFLARKGDGEPGAKTLWLGLQHIATFVEGLKYMQELQTEGTCV